VSESFDMMSGGAKIAAGVGVFIIASIVQATLGDSSMFSVSYLDRGLLSAMLVNATFWPGWLFTVGLIGAGIIDLLDAADEDVEVEAERPE
jgi:hypothetical protein